MKNRPDCYEYVRSFYLVPAYIGMRVRAGGRWGVLVHHRHAQHYLYILFDGDKCESGPFHPTDAIVFAPVVDPRGSKA